MGDVLTPYFVQNKAVSHSNYLLGFVFLSIESFLLMRKPDVKVTLKKRKVFPTQSQNTSFEGVLIKLFGTEF